MDVIIVLLLLLLSGLVVGVAVYLPRELRKTDGGAATASLSPASPNLDALRTELDARYQTEVDRLRGEARGAVGEIESELGRLREGLRLSSREQDDQLARLRDRFAEVESQTSRGLDQALVDLRVNQDAELGRLREAVGAAMTALAARSHVPEHNQAAERRRQAVADLYRRLAKLETAFISVTNPVLLPGESFALPAELLPETLRWENWKDVGDGAFAFAEAFNQDRIHLDDLTCREMTGFVRELREAMTTAIYPNLLRKPGTPPDETRAALRAALAQLGSDIPAARARLESAYRDEER